MKLTPSSMYCSRRSRPKLFSRGIRPVPLVWCQQLGAPTAFFSSRFIVGTCCSVTFVCTYLTSRGFLFVVVLLSDPDELGCPPLFSSAPSPPHRNIATNVILVACSSRVLSSPLPSRRQCLCSGHCLRCRRVVHPTQRILRV